MKQRSEDKFKSGIYVILNNVNSKRYVGKSINIYERIKKHITSLNTKCKDENLHLINSWHKYGRECFSYYVIEYIYEDNKELLEKRLKERELYWIQRLKTLDEKTGYNIRFDSESGLMVSEKAREKMRSAQIKRYKNLNERKICSMLSRQAHADHKESFEVAKIKLAYVNRKYRIAKCNKNTGEIIKIYEIIKEISDENPTFYLQAIRGCCQGTKRSYKGFRWHYCDLEKNELILKGMFVPK